MIMTDQKKLIEAALFISSGPLTLNELGKITGIGSLGFVKDLLEELQKEYESRGVEILNTPQGFVMSVRKEYLGKVSHLTPHSDLPEGSKRTLSLILYKEPARQSEIISMQGNKAYSYIKDLEKRGFLRSEKSGRTRLLTVTPEFEKYFGEDKEKIKDSLRSTVKEKKGDAAN